MIKHLNPNTTDAPLGLGFEFPEEGLWVIPTSIGKLVCHANSITGSWLLCSFPSFADALYWRDISSASFNTLRLIGTELDPRQCTLDELRDYCNPRQMIDGIGFYCAPHDQPQHILYVRSSSEVNNK